jgi:hypothetical protein
MRATVHTFCTCDIEKHWTSVHILFPTHRAKKSLASFFVHMQNADRYPYSTMESAWPLKSRRAARMTTWNQSKASSDSPLLRPEIAIASALPERLSTLEAISGDLYPWRSAEQF